MKIAPLVIGDRQVSVPIVQGGMGVRVSTSSLAGAVANCGAMGTIAGVGLGYGTALNEKDYYQASIDSLRFEIRRARELSKGVIGVNVMVALTNYDDLVKVANEEKVDYIASGAGLPLHLPGLVDNKHTKLIPIISSAQAASIMIRAWKKRFNKTPDAIVVEGPLAGGHLGFKRDDLLGDHRPKLEDIFTSVLKVAKDNEAAGNPRIPVIAGGGVFDGKDMAKFLRLGASAVQMATRFVATFECSVAEEFKQLYLKSKAEDAVIITSPVGMPGRAIRNEFVRQVEKGAKIPYECRYQCLRSCDPTTAPYCIAKAMFNAARGDVDNAIVFCGSNVGRVNKIVHVQDLVNEIMAEAQSELVKPS